MNQVRLFLLASTWIICIFVITVVFGRYYSLFRF